MEYRVIFIQNTYFAIFYLVEGRFSPLWWYCSIRSRRVETTTTTNKAGGEGKGVATWFMGRWGVPACRAHKSIISTGVFSLTLSPLSFILQWRLSLFPAWGIWRQGPFWFRLNCFSMKLTLKNGLLYYIAVYFGENTTFRRIIPLPPSGRRVIRKRSQYKQAASSSQLANCSCLDSSLAYCPMLNMEATSSFQTTWR